MKDLIGVPDGERRKHLNLNVAPVGFEAGRQVEPSLFQLGITKRATLFHRQEECLTELVAGKMFSPIDAPDVLGRLVKDVSTALVAESEGVIRSALSKRLKREDWSLDELEGRVEVHYPQNMPGVESYYLDGLPLVTFYPAQSEGSQYEIRMRRQYKLYD